MKRYRTSKRKSATQYSKLLKNPEFATIESERNLTVKKNWEIFGGRGNRADAGRVKELKKKFDYTASFDGGPSINELRLNARCKSESESESESDVADLPIELINEIIGRK